ncbi:hypothetical protein PSOL_04490 [Candidatus Phytoplasma solani]
MKNKKILLEFLSSITYLTEDAQDLNYREFLELRMAPFGT